MKIMFSSEYAYSHDSYGFEDRSKWMAKVNDEKKLYQLSIPGSHDTMSLGWGGDIAQTQSKSLKDQLISGIRFLDIRLGAYPNYPDLLYAYHGIIYLYKTFKEILDIVTEFLEKNPSETIFMRIKQENTDYHEFYELVRKFLSNTKYSKFMDMNKNTKSTLKKVRGKIVIFQNYYGILEWIYYGDRRFDIQDHYFLADNWDLYSKWETVKAQLNNANQGYLQGDERIFINYLSGSGGVFPYFVASGHSSPGTNAPLLATGLTEPAFHSYYPDFPRVNWFWGMATIAFQGTNELTRTYIDKNKPVYVGIVASDFPGQGLINSIINVNFNS